MNDTATRKCGHPLGSTRWCPDCELADMRTKHSGIDEALPSHVDLSEDVPLPQDTRGQGWGTAAIGAAAAEYESNRLRRLREAVQDLPEPVTVTRERGTSTVVSRQLSALRYRLDHLVRIEDRHGDAQEHMHRNRAERNALIFALQQLAPLADGMAVPAPPPPMRRSHSPEYVAGILEECAVHADTGFTVVDRARPGVLYHKSGMDKAGIEVPLAVWLYMLARQENAAGQEAGPPSPSGHE